MSDQNPYEKLGVSEDASFDEIQEARNRLLEQHGGDGKNLEMIEAAYDAILMERLRMRQEGKIKVPERIRFPEMRVQSLPKESQHPSSSVTCMATANIGSAYTIRYAFTRSLVSGFNYC